MVGIVDGCLSAQQLSNSHVRLEPAAISLFGMARSHDLPNRRLYG